MARKFVEDRTAATPTSRPTTCSRRWARCSTGWRSTRWRWPTELDWPAKLRLLEGYRQRDGLEWDDARLQLVDLQYSDVRPDKGLYHRLVARGSMQRLLTDDEVDRGDDRTRRTTPAPTSAASACGATGDRWPRRRGTRWSSTSAGRTWCGSRPWNRCAGPASTWAPSSSRRRRPPSWSTPSPIVIYEPVPVTPRG